MLFFFVKYSYFLFVAAALSVAHCVAADNLNTEENAKFQVEQITSGLSVPWGLAFLPDGQLVITERNGSVSLFNFKNQQLLQVTNTPEVWDNGQGGLLDVAVSPHYQKDSYLYFTYVKNIQGEGSTTLARAKLKTETSNKSQLSAISLVDWQELLVTKSSTDTNQHFGSRIAFDTSGHVFFGVGDRGVRSGAQDLMNHTGTIIRLKLNGSIPDDNPFVNTASALPEIWSYGHRNPQGMAYDKKNERLWSIEHGPRGGDELNLIEPAKNYGWPIISYGKEYWGPIDVGEGTHKKGMQQPVKVYIPSIAPGSLMLYSGDAFPQWKGNLFAGALKLKHINRILLDKSGRAVKEQRLLEDMNERVRALAQSPEGWIVFSTDSGSIYSIKPSK